VTGCTAGHTWAYLVELPPGGDGERRQVTEGGFATGKEAAEARAEVLAKHRAGALPKESKLTLGEWLRVWLTTQEEVRGLREGTMIDYRRHVEQYWIPRLGHLKLSELRVRNVTDALAGIAKARERAIQQALDRNAAVATAAEQHNAKRRAKGLRRTVKPTRSAFRVPSAPPPPSACMPLSGRL
jgi:hypothetical protein